MLVDVNVLAFLIEIQPIANQYYFYFRDGEGKII